MTEKDIFEALTRAGRAYIALHPEVAEIKLVFEDSEGGLLAHYYIRSEEREWELDQAIERLRREQEEAKALWWTRGESEPDRPILQVPGSESLPPRMMPRFARRIDAHRRITR